MGISVKMVLWLDFCMVFLVSKNLMVGKLRCISRMTLLEFSSIFKVSKMKAEIH